MRVPISSQSFLLASLATVAVAQQCPSGYTFDPIAAGTSSTSSTSTPSTSSGTSTTVPTTLSTSTVPSTSGAVSTDGSSTLSSSTASSTSGTATTDASSTSSSSTVSPTSGSVTTETTTDTSTTTSTSTTTTTSSSTTSTTSSSSSAAINWTACPTGSPAGLQCASLSVPIDYTQSGRKRQAQTLDLQLRRVPASNAGPDTRSIIYNPGGPGDSGIDALIADVNSGGELSELSGGNFHIVSFDPRGVGLSLPYQCKAIANIDGNGDYYTQSGLNATYTYNVQQGQECAKAEYGSDLIGTAFVARDINAIAQALGEDGLIRYWGFSYGTLLGATVAAMFPEKIERMILDGNINPTDYYHGLGDEAVADADAALTNYFDRCAQAGTPRCALAETNQNGDQLLAKFNTFLDGLRAKTITTNDGNGTTIYYGDVKGAMLKALKDPSKWISTATKIKTYYTNQATSTQKLAIRDVPVDDAGEDTNDLPLTGITCGDSDLMQNVDVAKFQQYLNLYNNRSRFAGDQLVSILFSCATWKINAKERFAGQFSGIQTKKPILFINTPFDPVTPLISANTSSSGFVGAKLQVHNGAGHCSTAQRSTALDAIINSYWNNNASLPMGNAATEPNQPNAFLPDSSPSAQRKRAVRNSKKEYDVPSLFNMVPRQVIIPPGCVPITSTTASTVSGTSTSSPVTTSTSNGVTIAPSSQTTSSTSNSNTIGPIPGTTTSSSSYTILPSGATWADWNAVPVTTSSWAQWSTASARPSSANNDVASWEQWVSENDATVTIYVISVDSVCPTGLEKVPITVTAKCDSKCTARPTGVPPGYTTTRVYCAACETPSYVVITTAAPSAPTGGYYGNKGGNGNDYNGGGSYDNNNSGNGGYGNGNGNGNGYDNNNGGNGNGYNNKNGDNGNGYYSGNSNNDVYSINNDNHGLAYSTIKVWTPAATYQYTAPADVNGNKNGYGNGAGPQPTGGASNSNNNGGYNGGNTNGDSNVGNDNGNAGSWSDWSASPTSSSIVKPYTGAASRLGGFFSLAASVIVGLVLGLVL